MITNLINSSEASHSLGIYFRATARGDCEAITPYDVSDMGVPYQLANWVFETETDFDLAVVVTGVSCY